MKCRRGRGAEVLRSALPGFPFLGSPARRGPSFPRPAKGGVGINIHHYDCTGTLIGLQCIVVVDGDFVGLGD